MVDSDFSVRALADPPLVEAERLVRTLAEPSALERTLGAFE
jgi:hypothetical protein